MEGKQGGGRGGEERERERGEGSNCFHGILDEKAVLHAQSRPGACVWCDCTHNSKKKWRTTNGKRAPRSSHLPTVSHERSSQWLNNAL